MFGMGFFGHTLAGLGMAWSTNSTNNAAECQGLMMALAWIMSLPRAVHVDVTVDSTFAKDCAMGAFHLQHFDLQAPSAKVRLLMQWFERWNRPVCLHWTASHAGTCGNKLADRVAVFCARRGFTGADVPSWVSRLLEHPTLAWAWAAIETVPGLPSLDVLQLGKYEAVDRIPKRCAEAVLQASIPSKGYQDSCFCLRLCTANVCTLKDKGPALRKQFLDESLDIVAKQETRLSSDATFLSDGWVVLQTSMRKGVDGCAFWLNSVRMAKALGLASFGLDDVVVLGARHDCLAVRLQSRALDVILVTFRAPHSQREDSEIRSWRRQARLEVVEFAG